VFYLSTLGCALLRVPPMRPSASLPFVWVGGKSEKWGGCGCVCALIVVKGGCPYTPFFSLSLSLRHNIGLHIDTQNTRCLIYSAFPKSVAPFIFPPSPYTEEAKLKCGSAYTRVLFFSTRPAVLMMPIIPRKKKNNNWELVKFLIWCLYL
jgi:hypothetical protein